MLSLVLFVVFFMAQKIYAMIQPAIAAKAAVAQIKDDIVTYGLARWFIAGDAIGTAIVFIFWIGLVCIWWGYVSYHFKHENDA